MAILITIVVVLVVIIGGVYGLFKYKNRPQKPDYFEYYTTQDTKPEGKVGVFATALIMPVNHNHAFFHNNGKFNLRVLRNVLIKIAFHYPVIIFYKFRLTLNYCLSSMLIQYNMRQNDTMQHRMMQCNVIQYHAMQFVFM